MSKETQAELRAKCKELANLLCAKNEAYGDSAFERNGVFSKLSPIEGCKLRMDDKLARIRNGQENALDEDSYLDLAGYLIIYLCLKDREKWKGCKVIRAGEQQFLGAKLNGASFPTPAERATEPTKSTPCVRGSGPCVGCGDCIDVEVRDVNQMKGLLTDAENQAIRRAEENR